MLASGISQGSGVGWRELCAGAPHDLQLGLGWQVICVSLFLSDSSHCDIQAYLLLMSLNYYYYHYYYHYYFIFVLSKDCLDGRDQLPLCPQETEIKASCSSADQRNH